MGDIDVDDTSVAGEKTFDTFGCDVYAKNPDTPDFLRPDVENVRGFYAKKIKAPDGKDIEIWGFEDHESDIEEPFPSAIIRVREGQIVHTKIKSRKGTHTIHLHGIDATTFNDGVGHTSFEVNGNYIYQYQPRDAGTYFYHCHKNTVLHFEMGMYGALIVDPAEGEGLLRREDELVRYDREAIWVADDIDPVWHQLNQNAGLCGEDEGLNDFNPKYFLISGVFNDKTKEAPVKITAQRGEVVVIRLLNASYTVLRTTMGFDAQVASIDGRTLGGIRHPWSRPYTIPKGRSFDMTSAQRQAMLVETADLAPGRYPVRMEFRHWITGEVVADGAGVAETLLEVV